MFEHAREELRKPNRQVWTLPLCDNGTVRSERDAERSFSDGRGSLAVRPYPARWRKSPIASGTPLSREPTGDALPPLYPLRSISWLKMGWLLAQAC